MLIEAKPEIYRIWQAELQAQLAAVASSVARVTLEIGCGHGHFLTAYAAAHPDEFCLGVDLQAERLARAERKRQRAGLANLAWVRGEADLVLDALPPGLQVGPRIFVLFPDPWPKRRHWKHRVMQPAFLARLAARSEPGAVLFFRTDHAGYYEASQALLAGHPDWQLAPETAWPFEEPSVFQSRAPTFHSLVARRRSALPPDERFVNFSAYS